MMRLSSPYLYSHGKMGIIEHLNVFYLKNSQRVSPGWQWLRPKLNPVFHRCICSFGISRLGRAVIDYSVIIDKPAKLWW
jgi:hypothetical protein